MPKNNDPFYAQKVILLEVYNAPTIDSNHNLRNNIKYSSEVNISITLFISIIALIINCIKNKYIYGYKNKIILILFCSITICIIILSIVILFILSSYSYISFDSAEKYITDLNYYQCTNQIALLIWLILSLILFFINALF
jgi:hypothetical protein